MAVVAPGACFHKSSLSNVTTQWCHFCGGRFLWLFIFILFWERRTWIVPYYFCTNPPISLVFFEFLGGWLIWVLKWFRHFFLFLCSLGVMAHWYSLLCDHGPRFKPSGVQVKRSAGPEPMSLTWVADGLSGLVWCRASKVFFKKSFAHSQLMSSVRVGEARGGWV